MWTGSSWSVACTIRAVLHSNPGVGVPRCGLRLTLAGCSVLRGRGMFEDPTRPGKQQQLGQELKELMSMEQALDQLIQSCSLNFKHLTEDKANKRYPLWLGGGVREQGPSACSSPCRHDARPPCGDKSPFRSGFCFFLLQGLSS